MPGHRFLGARQCSFSNRRFEATAEDFASGKQVAIEVRQEPITDGDHVTWNFDVRLRSGTPKKILNFGQVASQTQRKIGEFDPVHIVSITAGSIPLISNLFAGARPNSTQPVQRFIHLTQIPIQDFVPTCGGPCGRDRVRSIIVGIQIQGNSDLAKICLLYTSDAADE